MPGTTVTGLTELVAIIVLLARTSAGDHPRHGLHLPERPGQGEDDVSSLR